MSYETSTGLFMDYEEADEAKRALSELDQASNWQGQVWSLYSSTIVIFMS